MTDEKLAMYDRIGCLDDEQWMDVKGELVAEVRRLRALIRLAEWAGASGNPHEVEVCCPWCRGHAAEHMADCLAFPPQAVA